GRQARRNVSHLARTQETALAIGQKRRPQRKLATLAQTMAKNLNVSTQITHVALCPRNNVAEKLINLAQPRNPRLARFAVPPGYFVDREPGPRLDDTGRFKVAQHLIGQRLPHEGLYRGVGHCIASSAASCSSTRPNGEDALPCGSRISARRITPSGTP